MNETDVKFTRIRTNDTKLAKGHLQHDVTVEMVNPELSDDDLVIEQARIHALARRQWEEEAIKNG